MKIQDGLFLIILGAALLTRRATAVGALGIFFLFLAASLFYGWIFFTAQRLVMYAAICFFCSILLSLKRLS